MSYKKRKNLALIVAVLLTAVMAIQFTPVLRTDAADHVDAPNVIQNRGADIGDVFMFLDPNDNTRVIVSANYQNFVIPGEVLSQVTWDHNQRYRFDFENTGDAAPDLSVNVFFSRKLLEMTSQTATIQLPNGRSFTALTTPESILDTPFPPIITTDSQTGITFFAGERDDPFFFDVPAFKRFDLSARQNPGNPDKSFFQRARDTYAGFNTLHITFSIPVALVRGSSSVVGVQAVTERRNNNERTDIRIPVLARGGFFQVDRAANPSVNPDIISFPLKDQYNFSTPLDDAAGRFTPDITARLRLFGTNDANINVFLNLTQRRGDYVRLDTAIPNTGPQGGTNAGAGFPNGRRPADDVARVNLTLINNNVPLDDNIPSNDVPLLNQFPFFAPPQQPRPPGTIDDNTRN
jgi:hypothetical protein